MRIRALDYINPLMASNISVKWRVCKNRDKFNKVKIDDILQKVKLIPTFDIFSPSWSALVLNVAVNRYICDGETQTLQNALKKRLDKNSQNINKDPHYQLAYTIQYATK